MEKAENMNFEEFQPENSSDEYNLTENSEVALDSKNENEVKVPIKFNHKLEELSLEEAAIWAQKGKLSDKFMTKIRKFATDNGIDANEAIKRIVSYEEITEKENIPNTVKAEDEPIAGEADNVLERLAAGFEVLKREIPEIESVYSLPEEVIKTAAEEKIPLLDAYLRHRFYEQRAIAEEQRRQDEVKKASSGSQISVADENASTSQIEEMLKNVWRT